MSVFLRQSADILLFNLSNTGILDRFKLDVHGKDKKTKKMVAIAENNITRMEIASNKKNQILTRQSKKLKIEIKQKCT